MTLRLGTRACGMSPPSWEAVMPRLERRLKTWDYCVRSRRRYHLWRCVGLRCSCKPYLYYEKQKPGEGSRWNGAGRKHGNPKLPRSRGWAYRAAVAGRIAGNRAAREWCLSVRTIDPDDVDL